MSMKIEDLIARLYGPSVDHSDIGAAGAVLLAIAASLHGETVLESRDFARKLFTEVDRNIGANWDALRQSKLPSGEPPKVERHYGARIENIGKEIEATLRGLDNDEKTAALGSAAAAIIISERSNDPQKTAEFRVGAVREFCKLVANLVSIEVAAERSRRAV
jgi:hypothetical protein